jgi:tetratricopeptide (TPR) repeat protein
MSLMACTQHSVKDVQQTLDKQVQADQYYAQDDCDKALPLYLELANTMQLDTQNLLRAGNCYAKSKNYVNAEQTYQNVLLRDPSHLKAWYNLSYIRAQELADTVSNMYKNIDQTTPETEELRRLTIDVLAPFNLEIEP